MELSLKERLSGWLKTAVERALAFASLEPHLEEVDADFLPNFCHGWVVFNVAVIAEMLALVIALVMPRSVLSPTLAQDLLLISVYVQWIALTGTAVLCLARGRLNRLPNLRALGTAYLVLLAVTIAVAEAAVWLLWLTGRISTPRPVWHGDLHILSLTISAIINGLLLRYFLAKHELKRRTLSEARAKLQALQSRIRPHFVFNSLNIIASLTRSAPAKAETAIENMADLFRMMLAEDETLVPVKNEVDVAKKYLALENLRLDSRLQVEWDIGTFPRKAVMPVLTLQPLLENAIQHGIEPLPAGGAVSVRLWEENDKIHIRVVNPLPAKKSKRAEAAPSRTLENMRSRFQSYYGDAATLDAAEDDGRFTVTVTLPTRGGES